MKNLIDISSCSFEFAKELIRHNLVSSAQVLVAVCVRACVTCVTAVPLLTRWHVSPHVLLQVVFRGGEGALQVLPPLIDVIPEARLNLVIYYLRQGAQHSARGVRSRALEQNPTLMQHYAQTGP